MIQQQQQCIGTSEADKNDKEKLMSGSTLTGTTNRYCTYSALRPTTLRSIVVRPMAKRRNPARFRSGTVPFLQLATTVRTESEHR